MRIRSLVLVVFVIISCTLSAQEQKNNKGTIGITYLCGGVSAIINSANCTMDGEASYDVNDFYTLGVTYSKPILSWMDFETGIEYYNHTIKTTPMEIPVTQGNYSPHNSSLSLIVVPVTARVNFLRYFFVNGGLMLDYELENNSPIDSQNGIGAMCGVGTKYVLNNGVGAFANLNYKFHTLVAFSSDRDEYRWRLMEGGFRIGLTYSF